MSEHDRPDHAEHQQEPSPDEPDSRLPEPEERTLDGPSDEELLQAIQQRDPTRSSQLRNFIYLIVSIVLFGVIGSIHWNLNLVLQLLIVIGLHECGHLVAMKLCNYKNLKILFIPLLGGVASGEPQEQDGFKLALISLAGPLSGILCALVAVIAYMLTQQDVFMQFTMICVFLNLLNLLPIMPLDGGHFLNETLFSRYPKAELIFKILAVGALALLASTGGFLLWIIVFFVAVSIKPSYQMATAVHNLRQIDGMQEGELSARKVALIREELAQINSLYDRNPGLIHQAWQRINKLFPTMGHTVMLLGIYAASVVVYVLLGIVLLIFFRGVFAAA